MMIISCDTKVVRKLLKRFSLAIIQYLSTKYIKTFDNKYTIEIYMM